MEKLSEIVDKLIDSVVSETIGYFKDEHLILLKPKEKFIAQIRELLCEKCKEGINEKDAE